MSKHTPGPWAVALDAESVINICAPWSDQNRPVDSATFGSYLGAHICDISYSRNGVATHEQAIANARLIAAAPMLLDALRELLRDTQHADHDCGDEQCPVKRARLAIAAATGEETPA